MKTKYIDNKRPFTHFSYKLLQHFVQKLLIILREHFSRKTMIVPPFIRQSNRLVIESGINQEYFYSDNNEKNCVTCVTCVDFSSKFHYFISLDILDI